MHLEPSQIEAFETDGANLIKWLFHDWVDTIQARTLRGRVGGVISQS